MRHRKQGAGSARIAFELRNPLNSYHPADPLCGLNLNVGYDFVGIVKRRDLHVDLAGEDDVIGIE